MPNITFVAQDSINCRGTPYRFAGRRWHLVKVEPPHDLARGMARHIILENTTDHRRLRFVDRQVRHANGGSRDPAIAIGNFPEDDLATPRAPELAASIALGDLGALILRDYTLYLNQQPSLRIVAERRCVGKQYADAVPVKLIQHDHLVGVYAG